MVIFRLYIKKTLQHLTERCNQPKPTIKSRNGVKTNQDINSLNDEGERSPQTSSNLTLLD